jgi:signal transduction histidine kinase
LGWIGRGPCDRNQWWIWYLVGCALVAVAYLTISWRPTTSRAIDVAETALYDSVAVAAVAAVWLGIRLHRPSTPIAWYLILAGVTAFALGDLTYYTARLLRGPADFPTPADGVYLLGYLPFIAGLLILVHARAPRRERTALVDALIVTTGFGLVAWAFLVEPQVRTPDLSILQRLAAMAYPLADLLLLATAVRLAAGRPREAPALVLLLAGLYGQLVGDVAYTALSLYDAYQPGQVIDVGFLAKYAFVGAAALHPSMRTLAEPVVVLPTRLSRPRIAMLVVAGLVPPLLLYAHVDGGRDPAGLSLVTAAMTLLAALVFIRVASLGEMLAAQASANEHLLDETVRAVERERVTIATDLHDGPTQRLAGVRLAAELAGRRLRRGRADQAQALLDQLGHDVGAEITALRAVIGELHPPVLAEAGLGVALRDHLEQFEELSGVRCVHDLDYVGRLGGSRETILYRIAQEALANVAEHAKASTVWVRLEAGHSSAELTVMDDGSGFAGVDSGSVSEQGHFGLIGMRHRAEMAGGTFDVRSVPGQGTTVKVGLPYPTGR